MLPDEVPSWRQGGGPQPVKQAQDIGEQGSGDGNLRHLESDATAVAHDLRSNIDQLLANSANVGLWLQADIPWGTPKRPLLPQQQTFEFRCPLCPRFRPLNPWEQTFLVVSPKVCF